MGKKIEKAFGYVVRITDLVASVMLIVIVCSILHQIIFRHLSMNVRWTEEAARYSFVALVFFGGVGAVCKTEHIAITTLVDYLPLPVRRYFDIFIHLMMALMSGILSYSTLVLTRSAKGIMASSMLWFKMNYLYVPVGIVCVAMTAAALVRCVLLITDKTLLQREQDEKRQAEEAEQRKIIEEYEETHEEGKQ